MNVLRVFLSVFWMLKCDVMKFLIGMWVCVMLCGTISRGTSTFRGRFRRASIFEV